MEMIKLGMPPEEAVSVINWRMDRNGMDEVGNHNPK